MTDFVLELLRIDSHSKEESAVAQRLIDALREIGADVHVDDAGSRVGGDTGNVVGRLPGTRPGVAPLLLSSHMDTVTPGKGVKPVLEADRIRSDGTTILGGDDKSGLAIIVEALRVLTASGAPRGDIEIAFTICEEVGLLGAKALDYGALTSREALVLDSDSAAHMTTKAPSSQHFEYVVHGLESHAGVAPEAGISAVRVAAEAIAAMPLGRVDDETTSNLVIVEGGLATNVVPNRVVIRGEARSHDDRKLAAVTASISRCLQDAASRAAVTVEGVTTRAWIEERSVLEYERSNVADDAPIVALLKQAAGELGRPMATRTAGGGSDANVFNAKGISAVVLGTGMRDIHTVKEWLDLADFYAAAEIVLRALTVRAA